MKVEQARYEATGNQRLFYVTEKDVYPLVIAHLYTPASGKVDVEFRHLENGVYDLDYVFKNLGKYIFIIFENDVKTLILIVTIG